MGWSSCGSYWMQNGRLMRPCDKVIEAMFQIANEHAVTVDFVLNPPQRRYSSNAIERDIILKARREGFSSYTLAEFTVACLSQPNTQAVVMSHEDKATMRHLARVQFYLKHLKGAKADLHNQSRNLLTFPKTDSSFYIGTAGAKTFGRGDTITHLHLSEAAFYENPRAVVGGALQAASHAKRIVLESTANGYNWFKKLCDKSAKGRGRFRLHFFPWFEDDRNVIECPEGFVLHEVDKDLQDQYKLSDDQMYWYVTKREEFMEDDDDLDGLRLFKQEYPCTPEEAFQSSGAQYIGYFKYEESPYQTEGRMKIYKPPVKGEKYVIGGDFSGGIGQDYFVASIWRIAPKLEQVAVYRDHWTTPPSAAHVLERWGRKYNLAFLVPELNNHGYLALEVLKQIYPVNMIYQRTMPDSRALNKKRKVLGFTTSWKSRFHLMDTLKLYLRRGALVRDEQTFHELNALEEHGGRLQAPEGEFDDCAIAAALATMGVKKLVKEKPQESIETGPTVDYTKPLMPYDSLEDLYTQMHEKPHWEGPNWWPVYGAKNEKLSVG